MSTSIHLALKEIWRNRGRFLLFSLVIALITTLVLFVAALAEGLGSGNKEYLEKLNADLIVYQGDVDLSIVTSRIALSKLNNIKRVAGVKEVGPIGFGSATIAFEGDEEPLDISLIGVEPGKPGEPPVVVGRGLKRRRGKEAIIDKNVSLLTGLEVGHKFATKSIQGADKEFYTLEVIGISDSRKYGLRPSIFVPYLTWDRIKPQIVVGNNETELISNVVAVQLHHPEKLEYMSQFLEDQVSDIEAVDRKTAYEAAPGYKAQQSTLNTQRTFTLLIGVLVIGGFFQIQTLQKVAQIGMLKAIGTPNRTIVVSSVIQILVVNVFGVAIGSLATLGLSLGFPPNIPIVFTVNSVVTAVASLLIIGPLGGLVSIRFLLRVEPLIALGLSS